MSGNFMLKKKRIECSTAAWPSPPPLAEDLTQKLYHCSNKAADEIEYLGLFENYAGNASV